MALSRTDEMMMRRAIGLARRGLGYTSPNPAVGAVVVRDGKVVGEGWHQKAGLPHAEVNALKAAGNACEGADIYVTLEPCNHTGKTPPCSKAVLEAGIRRVVVGVRDPNPKAAGGVEFLRSKGIEVEVGCLEEECALLLAPFAKSVTEGVPWIRMKVASSLDGRTATRTGHSKWITGPLARSYGQRLREISDAILVGRTTVEADDPSLTFREEGRNQPYEKVLWRIILDSRLSLDLDKKVFSVSKGAPTAVICTSEAPGHRAERLEAKGVRVIRTARSGDGSVDPLEAMKALSSLGIHSVLVEGGAKVHGSFVDAGLVDEAFFFLAPMIIGGEGARPSVEGRGPDRLDGALRLVRRKVRGLGQDILITGPVTDPLRFWKP